MRCSIIVVLSAGVLISACNSQKQVKAKIIERKEVEGNRLSIIYKYEIDGKIFTDSTTIANKIIGNDSISISIAPSNPAKNTPQLGEE